MTETFVYFYVPFLVVTSLLLIIAGIEKSRYSDKFFKSPIMFIINVLGPIGAVYFYKYTDSISAFVFSIAFVLIILALSILMAKQEIEVRIKIMVIIALMFLMAFMVLL